MKKIELKLDNRSYEIIINSDIAFEISKELKKIKDIRNIVIITQQTIYNLYSKILDKVLHKNGLEFPLGVFKVNTNNSLINYDLDGLVEAGSYIYVNVTPDGTTGGDNLINCNINAFEVPLLNVF